MVVEPRGSKRHGIAEQWEVEVNASIDLQFSYIVSENSEFSGCIEV